MRNSKGLGLVAVALCLLLCAAVAAEMTAQSGRSTGGDTVSKDQLLKARLEQMYAAADFNGDGLGDVALVNFLTDSVNVMAGDAAGRFRTVTTLKTGSGPRSIATADFNRDGIADLAVGEFLGGSVRIFQGRGGAEFEEALAVPVGEGVSSLIAQDVDGTGTPDLVFANAMTGAVQALSNWNGVFSDRPLEIATAGAATVLAMDGNHDGILDIAAIDAAGNEATALIGTGSALFGDAKTADARALLSIVAATRVQGNFRLPQLEKIEGDGVARHAGVSDVPTLVVEIRRSGQAARGPGQEVMFSSLAGNAQNAETGAATGPLLESRPANENGRASLSLSLAGLPEVNVIAAALPADQATYFAVLSVLFDEEFGRAIEAAIAREVSEPLERSERGNLVRQAISRLNEGDTTGAVRWLTSLLHQMQSDRGENREDVESTAAEDWTRRFLNQVLLTGGRNNVADDEPLVCDTPLTKTIGVIGETDRFTFSCAIAEIVHITLGNHGGAFGFNPEWRLITSEGSAVCGTWGATDRDCTIGSGSYAVEVRDALGDATGTYSVHLQRLTSEQRCGQSLTCDVSITAAISAFADTDLYSFGDVAPENVHISIGNHGGSFGFNPQWRLIAPDGRPADVCGTWSPFDRECQPTQSGSYAVEVSDTASDATGNYSVHLQRLSEVQRCATSPTCDVALTATIDVFADTDLHGFAAVLNEIVHITLGNHGGSFGFNPEWRLIAPDGKASPVCGSWSSLERECKMPAAGAYAIEARDAAFDAGGTYSLHIQRLTSGQRCGGSITCDTSLTTTISAFADTDLYDFVGALNENVHISIGNHGGSFGFNPQWRLIAADGAAATVCGVWTLLDKECLLPAAGNYAIEVSDAAFDATGTYSLHLQRLSAPQRCSGSIACDIALTTTVDTFADTDLHSFTGVLDEKVHISIGNHGGSFGFNPQWRLIAENGTPAAVCGVWGIKDQDCTLPANGSYGIEVSDGAFDASGTYSLHLQRLTAAQRCAGAITCDVSITTTINVFADTDLHNFSGVVNESVHVSIGNHGGSFGFNPVWRLIAPDGGAASVCGTWIATDRDCVLPAGGAYAVEVGDGAFDASGTYSLHIQRLTEGQRCGARPECGKPVTTTIDAFADTDLYSIPAGPGTIHVVLVNNGGSFGFNPKWRLLDPNGIPVGGCTATDCTVSSSGVYAVEVSDDAFDASGTYTITITGCETLQANLKVTAVTGRARAAAGRSYKVTDTTQNAGTADAPTSTTGFFLSTDDQWDVTDKQLTPQRTVPSLAPAATSTGTTAVMIPASIPSGSFFILACADAGNAVVEKSESDNCMAKSVVVRARAQR